MNEFVFLINKNNEIMNKKSFKSNFFNIKKVYFTIQFIYN